MTEISRDIIVDLIPLYIAGEVSPASNEAVEAHLRTDASLSEYVRKAREESNAITADSSKPSVDLEMRSLTRTRKVLALQRWLFALAIAFTSVGLSTGIAFDRGRIASVRVLALDHPFLLVPCLLAAAVCWIGYARLRRA